MRLEKAEKKHLDAVLDIEKKCFSLPWSKQSFSDELRAKESYFIVALEGETVLGFCIIRVFDGEAELYNIAVAPEYRRQYIAEDMLREAMSYAKNNDASAVYLEVRKSNTAAQSLYKKVGFNDIGTRRDYYDFPTEDAVLMICELEM